MADDILTALDAAFARSRGKRLSRADVLVDDAIDDDAVEHAPAQDAPGVMERWPWVELFVGVQFLWGALLFLPGSQAYRPIVRALPYVSSLALLVAYVPIRFQLRYPW